MSVVLDISSPGQEGEMQVSKSRLLPILVDEREMEALLAHLGAVVLADGSRPLKKEEFFIEKEAFLKAYGSYIEALRGGKLPDETPLRPFFSAMVTCDAHLLYAMPLPSEKFFIKARKPVIQMKRHHFIYTDRLYSGVMGTGSITWGIQFSYPQLFLDSHTQLARAVDKGPDFPNSTLFHHLAKWIREHTLATPFLFGKERKMESIRLGKGCFAWINNHPGLKARDLEVSYG